MADIKWIKLVTDVFGNRKIKQIERMPDGDSVLVIWIKLLCLAGNTNDGGLIYFTKEMPYTDEMLATEFNRPIATVRMALGIFQKFKMIEIINSVLYISSWEKYQNTETLDKIREQTKKRVAEYREKKKLSLGCNATCNVTVTESNATEEDIEEELELDEELEKEKELDKDNKKQKNKGEHKCSVCYFENEQLNSSFTEYIEMRKKIKKPLATQHAIDLAVSKLKKLAEIPFTDDFDEELAIKILNQSVFQSWQGLFPLREEKVNTSNSYIDKIENRVAEVDKWV